MTRDEAYKTIAKHVFEAHHRFESGKQLIILADSLDEAQEKADATFGVTATVKRISATTDAQVYEI